MKTDIFIPEDGNRFPTLQVSWDQAAWGFTISDCVQKLRENDPVIEVLGRRQSQPGDRGPGRQSESAKNPKRPIILNWFR